MHINIDPDCSCVHCSFTRAWWLWLPLDRFPVHDPMCRSSEKEWTQLRTSLWVLIGWLPTGCLAISVSCAMHCLLTSVFREWLKKFFFANFVTVHVQVSLFAAVCRNVMQQCYLLMVMIGT